MSKLDILDRKILHELQLNNQLTSAQISQKIGLSPTSVQRRINQMRADKVIETDVAIVSRTALGRSLTMMVAVTLERERSDIIDHFKTALRKEPTVMSAYYVTGEADFILIISAKDMDEYEKFTRNFLYDNRDIKGFKTTVVMDRIKASFYVPPWE